MKPFARKFYHSKKWLKCRRIYIATVFGLCEKCQAPGHILHHKVELTPQNISNPEITLNFNNLEYLCLDCHNREHGSRTPTQKGLTFDKDGNLIQDTPPPPS